MKNFFGCGSAQGSTLSCYTGLGPKSGRPLPAQQSDKGQTYRKVFVVRAKLIFSVADCLRGMATTKGDSYERYMEEDVACRFK